MRSRGRRFEDVSSDLYSQFQTVNLKLEERAAQIAQKARELEGHLQRSHEAAQALPDSQNLLAELDEAKKAVTAMRRMLKELGQVLAFVQRMGKTWSLLVQETTDGVVVLQDRRIMYVNRRLTEMWGYAVEEVRNRRLTDFMPPDEVLRLFCLYEKSRVDQLPERIETAIMSKDGERIDVSVTKWQWIFGGDGAGLLVICDLREKKKVDRRLATYSEYIERIVGEQLQAIARTSEPRYEGVQR